MRRLATLAAAAALLGAAAAPAAASAAQPPRALLDEVALQYRQAAVAHDAALAARLRTETRLLALAYPSPARERLARTLKATTDPLQPWPVASDVAAQAARAGGGGASRAATGAATPGADVARPYDAVRAALAAAGGAPRLAAVRDALNAWALSAGIRTRLGTNAAALDAAFWSRTGVMTALAADAPPAAVHAAAGRAGDAVSTAQQVLGDVTISRATVVSDAAILVFREGLEAVLILAAITASFVGARRHLRRPVLLGGIAGIGATAATWALVQLLLDQLGTGGLRLEAITGIVAIAVLLLVTNWFFHRVYWSQWIARFNRRRKSLERLDRFGFISGQALALALLGLTSVYREGFETVLFIQNLQVSAGTSACLLGTGIGLAATLAVGAVTFTMQRKLPYKRMLIATGVLIALVLAVMTGTTVHVMQGLGWLPTTPAGFTLPIWVNSWLGLYATWEGIAAQLGALVIVLGSYFVAREVQVRRPQRKRARAVTTERTPLAAAAETPPVSTG